MSEFAIQFHLHDFSLSQHECGYDLSLSDVIFSLITGCRGDPYASRHWELSNRYDLNTNEFWFHRTLATIEHIPLVGGLVALIEVISVYVCTLLHIDCHTSSVKKRDLNSLQKNLQKALIEHREKAEQDFTDKINLKAKKKRFNESMFKYAKGEIAQVYGKRLEGLQETFTSPYISIEEISSLQYRTRPSLPSLAFNISSAEAKGARRAMEDAKLVLEDERGILAAIFDGHKDSSYKELNGGEVAHYACQAFQQRFFAILDKEKGDVVHAFETLIDQIQNELREKRELAEVGSTAVFTFFDKRDHVIYTGTLGDSEAKVYIDGRSIPLSPVRNWETDFERAKEALGEEEIEGWYQTPNKLRSSKDLRVKGLNTSRGLGDATLSEINGKPVVIQKAKFTACQLDPKERGFTLILGCDGLWDAVQESQIAAIVERYARGENQVQEGIVNQYIKEFDKIENLAQELVYQAVEIDESGDNVSVIAIQIKNLSL